MTPRPPPMQTSKERKRGPRRASAGPRSLQRSSQQQGTEHLHVPPPPGGWARTVWHAQHSQCTTASRKGQPVICNNMGDPRVHCDDRWARHTKTHCRRPWHKDLTSNSQKPSADGWLPGAGSGGDREGSAKGSRGSGYTMSGSWGAAEHSNYG